MAYRVAGGLLLITMAIACSESKDVNDPGGNVGGGGSAHSAGASGEAGEADPITLGGAGGDTAPGGAGGDLNLGGEGGAGGVASVQFWTPATQHIEIACFGYFDGFATFRADRAELSAEQVVLLAKQTGVPGSTYDGNDDQIHCVVTTTDTAEHERKFTIDGNSDLFGFAPNIAVNGGEGGAGGESGAGGEGGAGPDEFPAATVLGCEFHHPFPDGTAHGQLPPYLANPFCVRQLWAEGASSRFGLALATPAKPYHIEVVHCSQQSIGDTKVELFGLDPGTPIATGVIPPDGPGPDDACLVLDAQVEAPTVGRLVFSSASSTLKSRDVTFR